MLQERHDIPGSDTAAGIVVWLSRLQSAYGRCDLSLYPDLEQALVSPAAVFADPDEVVRHPLLSHACKREILWRWAWDEYLIDVAQAEGMPEGPPSRLEEVRTALQRLGEEWRPHPAAPAMRLPAFGLEVMAEAASGEPHETGWREWHCPDPLPLCSDPQSVARLPHRHCRRTCCALG